MRTTIIFLVLSSFLAIGCGKIEVGDSVQTVRHEVSLDSLHQEIVSMCRDAYTTPVDEQTCIQDTLKSLLASLQSGEFNPLPQ